MIIWKHDKMTGIECGVNDDGDLFIGNDESGAIMQDTPANREKILREFDRYTTLTENHDAYLPDRIDATDKLWHQLCAMLPTAPREDYLYWATWDDTEILSADSDAIDRLADLFDDLYGEGTTTTGYYDPEEDRRNNEVDGRTGYYYCSNA